MTQYDNTSSKYGIFMDDKTLLNFTHTCQCECLTLAHVITSRQMGIGLPPWNLFSEIVEDVLQRLIPTGVVKHLIDYHTWIVYRNGNFKSGEQEPKILTLDDLGFGFVLWLTACAISAIGYLFEIVMFRWRKKHRTFIGLVLFLKVLRESLRKGH